MKYRKHHLFYPILFCLFYACTFHTKTTEADKTLQIDATDFTDWTSLLHIEEITPLGENSDSLLSVAQKCLINDERFLFWDFKMKCVYAYDRQGNFLFTIGRQGGAEFECADLRDIYLGKTKTELLDATGILVFDAKDGHFMEKKKLAETNTAEYFKFQPLEDNQYLLFSPDKEYTVYRWADGKLTGLQERKGHQLITNHFQPYGNECLIYPDYGHFVVQAYANGTLRTKYFLDFGSKAFPLRQLPQNGAQFEQTDSWPEYFKSVTELRESDKWLYAKAVGPEQTYYDILYDKSSDRLWAGPTDLDLGLIPIDVEGESFYGLIYPEYLAEDCAWYDTLKGSMPEGRESNPVLVKFAVNECDFLFP